MIKEIFLPETIFGKRLIAKTILGIFINKTKISAAKISAYSNKIYIEKLKELTINLTNEIEVQKNISDSLKAISLEMGKFDRLIISIPSSLIIFKETNFPFSDEDSIRLILESEIESKIPFPLEDTIADFVITHKEDKGATTLLGIGRISDISQILDTCHQANLEPERILVDCIAIYNIYMQIPTYRDITDGSSIVIVETDYTTIIFLEKGIIKLIRTIPKGILSIAKSISEELKIDESKAIELLKAQSFESNTAIKNSLLSFLNEIQYTLSAFILKINFNGSINKILFSGEAHKINNLEQISSTILQANCEILDPKLLLPIANIINKSSTQPNDLRNFSFALGTAIPNPIIDDFNLRRKSLKLGINKLFRMQFYATMILVLALLSTTITIGYLQIRNLNSIETKIEKDQVRTLKKIVTSDYGNTQDRAINQIMKRLNKEEKLASVVKSVEGIIQVEESNWLPLTTMRLNPLEILDILTKVIDRKEFDVSIDEVSILISDEDNLPIIEVSGLLKPKTAGEDYKEFQKFENSISTKSNKLGTITLVSTSPEPPLDTGGVKFSLNFKMKKK